MGFEREGALPGAVVAAASRTGADQGAAGREVWSVRERNRRPLGANGSGPSFERRLRTWLWSLGLVLTACAGLLGWMDTKSAAIGAVCAAATSLGLLLALGNLFEKLTRPLQTLSNVVAALRSDDFSLRAQGARRGDALGDLALEINLLAATLQTQRGAAQDALTLAERVMVAMRTPVLAFAGDRRLRLINPAAERSFGLERATALGREAEQNGLEHLVSLDDGAVYSHPRLAGVAGKTRWVVRWSGFRLGGVPHRLVVLSDVDAVLREEERTAWQRLIRVLSHEINNSLTPIASVAGSLRESLLEVEAEVELETLRRLEQGLRLIEDRAFSLHRFVQAYQKLSRLPRPTIAAVAVEELVAGAVALESRVPVRVVAGPAVIVQVDAGQMEQLLINLLRNAAEAALSLERVGHVAEVWLRWGVVDTELRLRVEDNGPGLSESANLFVPFYTTKLGGSGIGLVLAQQIAHAHRGRLALQNRPDAIGCVAEFRLPLS